MKKAFKLSICMLLIVFCFTSCSMITDYADAALQSGLEYVFTTKSYRLYRDFYCNYEVGMDKQDVLDKLDYPESYYNKSGNLYHRSSFRTNEERETYNQGVLDDGSTLWHYTCHRLKDPADPYSLTIHFDSEGKCTSVSFKQIPGG